MDTLIQSQSALASDAVGAAAAGASASALASAARAGNVAKARAAAEDFEAFFLAQMMQPMFSGLSTEPPFGGGHAETVWRSLLVDEYGRMIARQGGVGVADGVMRTMLSTQDVTA
ncbi:rod-binding protein [uncultured Rhodospira sp.]|uniref:rod-binding protein n=1 Tax=uncultured Rhodospira sp. TaxID=1936189 RepID=UPI0026228BE5|nr:rod-binding protein [uncultured Rhodospira sp.]